MRTCKVQEVGRCSLQKNGSNVAARMPHAHTYAKEGNVHRRHGGTASLRPRLSPSPALSGLLCTRSNKNTFDYWRRWAGEVDVNRSPHTEPHCPSKLLQTGERQVSSKAPRQWRPEARRAIEPCLRTWDASYHAPFGERHVRGSTSGRSCSSRSHIRVPPPVNICLFPTPCPPPTCSLSVMTDPARLNCCHYFCWCVSACTARHSTARIASACMHVAVLARECSMPVVICTKGAGQ